MPFTILYILRAMLQQLSLCDNLCTITYWSTRVPSKCPRSGFARWHQSWSPRPGWAPSRSILKLTFWIWHLVQCLSHIKVIRNWLCWHFFYAFILSFSFILLLTFCLVLSLVTFVLYLRELSGDGFALRWPRSSPTKHAAVNRIRQLHMKPSEPSRYSAQPLQNHFATWRNLP